MRTALQARAGVVEKKMFGGYCWMLRGNMLCGVEVGRFMFRVGKDQEAEALSRPGASPMDITGRPMKGYVFVEPDGYASDEALLEWVSGSHRFAAGLPPKTPGKAHRGPSPASSSGATGKKRRP